MYFHPYFGDELHRKLLRFFHNYKARNCCRVKLRGTINKKWRLTSCFIMLIKISKTTLTVISLQEQSPEWSVKSNYQFDRVTLNIKSISQRSHETLLCLSYDQSGDELCLSYSESKKGLFKNTQSRRDLLNFSKYYCPYQYIKIHTKTKTTTTSWPIKMFQ